MCSRRRHPKPTRSPAGSAMSEFGAALWIIIIGFLFPCITLVSLIVTYACCFVLNANQTEEAALMPQTQGQNFSLITSNMPRAWAQSGLGQFSQIQAMPVTQITYQEAVNPGPDGSPQGPQTIVVVNTSFTVQPLISIPVMGLDQPINFAIKSQRPLEDPNSYNAP